VSNIHHAINYLYKRIGALEAVAQQHEQTVKSKIRAARKSPEPDLFNNVVTKPGNVHVIEPSLLARKLDSAIEKVEQMLKEGQA